MKPGLFQLSMGSSVNMEVMLLGRSSHSEELQLTRPACARVFRVMTCSKISGINKNFRLHKIYIFLIFDINGMHMSRSYEI